jgi:hypothetical protein
MRKASVTTALTCVISISASSLSHAADTPPSAPTSQATQTQTPKPTPTPTLTPTPTPTPTPTATSAPAPTPTPTASPTPTPTASPTPTPSATQAAPNDPLASSRALISAKKFAQALSELTQLNKTIVNDADLLNLLGFTSRKLNKLKDSEKYYQKALAINPNHLGALEYQGELFVLQQKISLAKRNLAKLKTLCGSECEEYLDLKKAIAEKRVRSNKY